MFTMERYSLKQLIASVTLIAAGLGFLSAFANAGQLAAPMPELLVVLGFACIGIGIFVLQP